MTKQQIENMKEQYNQIVANTKYTNLNNDNFKLLKWGQLINGAVGTISKFVP